MENAAEAIKMAGGLLIGLLLISLFIFVFAKIENLETERDQQVLIEQVAEFNKKFNAYNKTTMYGTDLISVLGLAYANNKTANIETTHRTSMANFYDGYYDENLEGSINIEFKLNEPIQRVVTKEVYRINSKTQERTRISKEKLPATNTNRNPIIFAGSRTYSLAGTGTEETLRNIKEIVIDGNSTTTNIEEKSYIASDGTRYLEETLIIEDVQGFNEMKQCLFECTVVKYSPTGRIKEMLFEQKNI